MDTLWRLFRRYGVQPSLGAAPLLPERGRRAVGEDFFESAEEVLQQIAPEVRRHIRTELQTLPGRWHPSGYMIFPLGIHDRLGRLRLHVWPAGLRRRELRPVDETRDIHDHVMHIVSYILDGVYQDRFYSVREYGGEHGSELLNGERVYRVFVPAAGLPGATAMEASDVRVAASALHERVYHSGTVHQITAGEFHVPTIPDDVFVATLLFSSPPVLTQGPRVLVTGSVDRLLGDVRWVDASDALFARSQFQGGC